jgi:hypothetical protein
MEVTTRSMRCWSVLATGTGIYDTLATSTFKFDDTSSVAIGLAMQLWQLYGIKASVFHEKNTFAVYSING